MYGITGFNYQSLRANTSRTVNFSQRHGEKSAEERLVAFYQQGCPDLQKQEATRCLTHLLADRDEAIIQSIRERLGDENNNNRRKLEDDIKRIQVRTEYTPTEIPRKGSGRNLREEAEKRPAGISSTSAFVTIGKPS